MMRRGVMGAVLAGVVAAGAGAPAAHAGTYAGRTCGNGAQAGLTQVKAGPAFAWRFSNTCGQGGGSGYRATSGPGTVPAGASATAKLSARPGTRFARLSGVVAGAARAARAYTRVFARNRDGSVQQLLGANGPFGGQVQGGPWTFGTEVTAIESVAQRSARVLLSTGTRTLRAGYGRSVLLRGRVVDAAGVNVGGAGLLVRVQPRIGGLFTEVARTATAPDGTFAVRVPAGPSRRIEVVSGGAQTATRLEVSAGVRLTARRSRIRNGQTARFRGTVRGGLIPARGVLVDLQVRVGRRYTTLRTIRVRRKDGAFAASYRFRRSRGSTSYRFRARVRADSLFPFAGGVSRSTVVRVSG
jgi:hypothetical protein